MHGSIEGGDDGRDRMDADAERLNGELYDAIDPGDVFLRAYAEAAGVPVDAAPGRRRWNKGALTEAEALSRKLAQASRVIDWLLEECNIRHTAEGRRASTYFAPGAYDPEFEPWPRVAGKQTHHRKRRG